MSSPTDIVVLVAHANKAIQATDTLWEHKVELDTLVKQCKAAKLVEKHLTSVLGNTKNEDALCAQKSQALPSIYQLCPTHRLSVNLTLQQVRAAAVAVALATASAPPEAPPAKPSIASGKSKARAPPKYSHHLANSKAIIKDTSKEEASVVAATKEDIVMGNLEASNTPPETDSMNINDEVEVIFLKTKKVVQAAQREKEKAEHHAEAIQAAEAIIAKGKADEAASQVRKHAHASTDHAFKDYLFTITAADLAINNEASQSTIDAAAALVSAGDHGNPSEHVLHSREADLCNNVIATTHKIEYLLKYHEFVVAHHSQVAQQLESCLPMLMVADSPAPVASSSKLN
ncbi:hypothetical protein F5146DRAFT_1144081 [Armillaria mellea]|nr:hypothetical protein F5146DRAFT_1144081 [Armillaria mellea]